LRKSSNETLGQALDAFDQQRQVDFGQGCIFQALPFPAVRSPLIATVDRAAYVCFWHKADIAIVLNDVRFRG
jgi:hypothetical protein